MKFAEKLMILIGGGGGGGGGITNVTSFVKSLNLFTHVYLKLAKMYDAELNNRKKYILYELVFKKKYAYQEEDMKQVSFGLKFLSLRNLQQNLPATAILVLADWSSNESGSFRLNSSAQNHFGPGLLGPNRFFYWDPSARDSSAQVLNTLFVVYN